MEAVDLGILTRLGAHCAGLTGMLPDLLLPHLLSLLQVLLASVQVYQIFEDYLEGLRSNGESALPFGRFHQDEIDPSFFDVEDQVTDFSDVALLFAQNPRTHQLFGESDFTLLLLLAYPLTGALLLLAETFTGAVLLLLAEFLLLTRLGAKLLLTVLLLSALLLLAFAVRSAELELLLAAIVILPEELVDLAGALILTELCNLHLLDSRSLLPALLVNVHGQPDLIILLLD